MVENFGLLNDLFPFPSILDAGHPVINLHLANILFDVILLSVLGSSLWSFGLGFPFKYLLNCSGIWHSLFVTKNSTYDLILILVRNGSFLGAFAKLRKATTSFVMSLSCCLCVRPHGSHWTDFHEYRCAKVFKNLSRKSKFH